MCSVFDNEEVGSGTKQGAGSTFGADVLKYNVAQKYTTDARSAAPEKAAYIYAGQIRDEFSIIVSILGIIFASEIIKIFAIGFTGEKCIPLLLYQ